MTFLLNLLTATVTPDRLPSKVPQAIDRDAGPS